MSMSLYPVESGFIHRVDGLYTRLKETDEIHFESACLNRGYVEWDISVLFGEIITKVEFRYEGKENPAVDNCYIYSMEQQPSIVGNSTVWNDAGDGIAYLNNNAVFPEVGTLKDVGGATGPAWDTDPLSALQSAVDAERSWFALGFQNDEITQFDYTSLYSERKSGVTPFPTLYVEYFVPESGSPTPEPPPVDPEYKEEHPEYVSPPAPTKKYTSNRHVSVPFLPYRTRMRTRRIMRHVTRRVRG